MKVIDAGVVIDLLVGKLQPECLGDEELAAPHLIDSEVTNVLRRLVRIRALSEDEGAIALEGFMSLVIQRFPADWLCPRIWELKENLSAYDATYVALTEMIDATALLTTDARLASAPGLTCRVEVV